MNDRMKAITVPVGKKIKALRTLRGISQEEFSEMTDITQQAMSRIETGKVYMTYQTLEKILDALEIDYFDLFPTKKSLSNEELFKTITEKVATVKGNNLMLSKINDMLDILLH